MPNISVIHSPVGNLKIISNRQQLEKIELNCLDDLQTPTDDIAKSVAQQLADYFQSANFSFMLPTLIQGTDFQKRVWDLLKVIPVGEVWTYGEMAKKLKTSARAVGNACRHNPIPIIVPCHRVVAASGLGGFAGQVSGSLTQIKSTLLRHEGVQIG